MRRVFTIFAFLFATAATRAAQDGPPLLLKTRISLPGVAGRIDHFSADLNGRRIFMSALGNHSVEVLDAHAFRLLGRITAFDEPQRVLFDGTSNRLLVASAGDGTSLKLLAPIRLADDADNIRFDSRRSIVVGYASGTGEVKLGGHPELFQLEWDGHRLFVNVPGRLEIAVVDLDKQSAIARWREWTALSNFPMALDEAGQRLFTGFRNPARMLAIDTDSGKIAAATDIVADADDLFYDPATGPCLSNRRRAGWLRSKYMKFEAAYDWYA